MIDTSNSETFTSAFAGNHPFYSLARLEEASKAARKNEMGRSPLLLHVNSLARAILDGSNTYLKRTEDSSSLWSPCWGFWTSGRSRRESANPSQGVGHCQQWVALAYSPTRACCWEWAGQKGSEEETLPKNENCPLSKMEEYIRSPEEFRQIWSPTIF